MRINILLIFIAYRILSVRERGEYSRNCFKPDIVYLFKGANMKIYYFYVSNKCNNLLNIAPYEFDFFMHFHNHIKFNRHKMYPYT